jgi:hypothetical protein
MTRATTALLTVDVSPASDGTVSFWSWRDLASSDIVRFAVDGVEVGTFSGASNRWTQSSYPLTAGPHVLSWTYAASDSTSSFYDRTFFIDDLELTGYPASCPAADLCSVSGYAGDACLTCDTGACP